MAQPDQARLLLRTDGGGFGVFAFLCRGDGVAAPHLILHNRELVLFTNVGIKPIEPGLYRTACGKGFIDCYTGEPHEVRLTHFAIDYFKAQSVASLFYWSDSAGAFKWVAMADDLRGGGRAMTARGPQPRSSRPISFRRCAMSANVAVRNSFTGPNGDPVAWWNRRHRSATKSSTLRRSAALTSRNLSAR